MEVEVFVSSSIPSLSSVNDYTPVPQFITLLKCFPPDDETGNVVGCGGGSDGFEWGSLDNH